jgi:hypothetical protein
MRIIEYILCTLFVFVLFNILSKYWRSSNSDKNFIINTIIRGCARWAAASLQDKSPLVAVLHANYASGYLWALRDTFSDEEIKRSSGVNIIQFQKRITDIQDIATKSMISVCPKYASDIDTYLGKIGGEWSN